MTHLRILFPCCDAVCDCSGDVDDGDGTRTWSLNSTMTTSLNSTMRVNSTTSLNSTMRLNSTMILNATMKLNATMILSPSATVTLTFYHDPRSWRTYFLCCGDVWSSWVLDFPMLSPLGGCWKEAWSRAMRWSWWRSKGAWNVATMMGEIPRGDSDCCRLFGFCT